jgi:hypothetical protein
MKVSAWSSVMVGILGAAGLGVAAEPARPGAIVPPEVPAAKLEFKSRSASVKVAARKLSEVMVDVAAPTRVFELGAKIEDAPGIGPAQFVFEPPLEQPSNAMMMLSMSLPEKLGGWPRDCLIVFDDRGFNAPSTLACAVLIEAMLAGKDVAPNAVLHGSLEPREFSIFPPNYPLKPEGGVVTAAARALAAKKKPLRLIGGIPKDGGTYDDLRTGDAAAMASIHDLQVIGCKDLNAVLELLGITEGKTHAMQLLSFDETQAVIRKVGDAVIKNAKVQERVKATLAALPNHITAQHYADIAGNTLPAHRDEAASWRFLNALWLRVAGAVGDGQGGTGVQLQAFSGDLSLAKATLHPNHEAVVDRMTKFFTVAPEVYAKLDARADDFDTQLFEQLQSERINIDGELRKLKP